MNTAFVFIKPHAVGEKTKAMTVATLAEQGIEVLREGSLTGPEIDAGQLIDQHYYAIASKATLVKPSALPIPEDKFEAKFGLSWTDALASGRVYNALDACAYLGVDADEINDLWAKAKSAGNLIKFGGGFYCGIVDGVDGKDPIYTFNAFFMQMRSKFVAKDASISYFVVEWDSKDLSWADFRGKVLGPTDPADAPADSVRGRVLAQWKELGLATKPNTGDNGVHASASPFEALAERMNWLGVSVEDDSFGKTLLEAGITAETIKAWSVDPQVALGDGTTGSLFDALEDMDTGACLARCVEINAAN